MDTTFLLFAKHKKKIELGIYVSHCKAPIYFFFDGNRILLTIYLACTRSLPTQRKRASCPGEGARRKCPRLIRPAGRPLRGTAVTRTAGGSLAAVAAAGARPPRRGSTTREAPRTAGRPRALPWPGTRLGEEAPARGTTRRSGASSASPSPPAGGSELPRTTPTNSESGRQLLG